MNINEAIVIIDDLCGKQGLFSVAWKMVRARLYVEAQKPSHNTANLSLLLTKFRTENGSLGVSEDLAVSSFVLWMQQQQV
jgi:hypothetical protein